MIKTEIGGIPMVWISSDSVGHNYQIGDVLIMRTHATGRFHFIKNGRIHHDVTVFQLSNIFGN